MITKIVFVVMFIVSARLSVDSYRRGSFGFREIEHGVELAALSSLIALLLFGPIDAIGAASVFCYEIYNKVVGKNRE
mgnify:CR=1 FL=1